MTDTRPRLCIVVTSAATAKTFLRGYLRFLHEDGWAVVLICNDGPGLETFAAHEGVRVHTLAMRRDPSVFHDLRSLIALFTLLRRLRPDTLVYATPKASFLGALAGWFARVPRRVYELWGLRVETTSGFRRRIFHTLEFLTARLSTLTIANSQSLAARAVELGVNGGKEVVVLGSGSSHGVDAEYFRPDIELPEMDVQTAAALADISAPVVGFVGRLHPDKGVDTLVEALRLCALRGTRVQALIVGGAEGYDVADGTIAQAGVHIHLTGRVDDPRPYLAAMDVLVLPSKREGFPNVVLEAAAMEVPAIVSNATGCVDAVNDGVTGLVVPVGDSAALAEALQHMLTESTLSMGRAARARVINDYAPAHVWRLHSRAWRQ